MSDSSKTTTSTNTLAPWSQQQYGNLSGQIEGDLSPGLASYTGQLAPDLSAGQTQATAMANSNIGLGTGAVQSGVNAATGLTGYSAPTVAAPTMSAASAGPAALTGSQGYTAAQAQAANAGSAATTAGSQIDPSLLNQVSTQGLTGVDLSQYMDPNIQATLTPTLALLQQQEGQTIAQQQGQFTQAGAFGGSREGVADSLTNQDYANVESQTIANAYNTAYTNASQNAETDLSRNLAGQQSNQATDLSAGTTNAGLTENSDLANQAAINAQNQYNAGLTETTGLANQSATNTAGQFGAGAANTAALSNQGALNTNAEYNASNQQAANSTNASLNLAGQEANQNASIAGAGIDLSSAGLLGQLGTTQQNMGLADTNAIDQLGTQAQTTQAAQDQAAYNYYLLQQQYPFMQTQALEGLLGATPMLSNGKQVQTSNPSILGLLGQGLQAGSSIASMIPGG